MTIHFRQAISRFGDTFTLLSAIPILIEKLYVQFWGMSSQKHTTTAMLRSKRIWWIILGHLVAFLILMTEAKAQSGLSQGYIYGRVKTFDNQYEGLIRWDDEEIFWFDHFNAAKIENDYYEKIRTENRPTTTKSWDDIIIDFSSIWEDKISNTIHQFTCQFGDIDRITDLGRERLTLVLKNGEKIRLNGEGYNDVGATLQMTDNDLGELKIRWERIEEIQFMEAPSRANVRDRLPIYGRVETFRKGTFIGYIQWDRDERLASEKLDGDNRDGDISIAFGDIRSIVKEGNGCGVVTNSGREFYLTNSNDVDNDNRGLVMTIPEVGKIEIPWKYFKSVDLERPNTAGPGFEDYSRPEGLFGTVYTVDEKRLNGKIIFDIDETWELEILEGKDDDVEYKIPFRNIKSITPKNYNFSMVELRNGDRILLGDSRDVSDQNDGLLIYQSPNDKPIHVSWDRVAEITFR